MVLAFDIDGVLADFTSSYAKRIVKVTGENLFPTPLTIPCWDWDTHYGYTKDQIAATWESIQDDSLFWQKLNPIPDRELFARLNVLSKSHPMYFITNRIGKNCKQQTERFLYEQGINYPTVLIAANKKPIIEALKIDFFIDDRLETMNELLPLGKEFFYLKDTTYNQKGRSVGMRIVPDVKEALEKAGLW
jgi:5'(3')-deoxyribonucleotidase